MVFFPLISESGRSAPQRTNFMLVFQLRARFIITKFTMTPSWTHFSGAMLTIVFINSIQLARGMLQSILWEPTTSLHLPMHHAMIESRIQWRISSVLMWMKWYFLNRVKIHSLFFYDYEAQYTTAFAYNLGAGTLSFITYINVFIDQMKSSMFYWASRNLNVTNLSSSNKSLSFVGTSFSSRSWRIWFSV